MSISSGGSSGWASGTGFSGISAGASEEGSDSSSSGAEEGSASSSSSVSGVSAGVMTVAPGPEGGITVVPPPLGVVLGWVIRVYTKVRIFSMGLDDRVLVRL